MNNFEIRIPSKLVQISFKIGAYFCKKRKMKHFYLSLIIIFSTLLCLPVLSGQPSAGQIGGGLEPEPVVKPAVIGTIVDQDTQSPLEFATITIFASKDSSLIGGGVTDLKGDFKIEVKPGTYWVKLEFIAYQALIVENVIVTKNTPEVDLGTIGLLPAAEVLAEVEVIAEKSTMQLALDKKIFNVGKDLANIGGSASDILDNVPSVSVDIEGNVSLRGSSAVRILVNGQPSTLVGLSNTDGLRQLPANLIERIEVITNPSARYEAEGMAGIINIVLKKERSKGLNGSFDVNVGYPDNYGTSLNLNYRRDKINFFTSYGLRYRKNPGSSSRYQEFYGDTSTTIIDQIGTRERGGWSNNIRLGTDIFFNKNNTLTSTFTYSFSDENNNSETKFETYLNSKDNLQELSRRFENELEDENELEYSLIYKKTFEQKDREFIVNLQYQESTEGENSTYREAFFNSDGTPSNDADLNQRSNNDEGQKNWSLQLDYIHPISKDGKFETGLRGTLRDITNDYLVEELADGTWLNLENLSNNFIYNEDIYAAYAIFGNKINRFSYQLGLRLEHSEVLTELLQTNEVNDRSYTNLFPSAHVTYELAANNAIQLSYSRRLRRPRFWDLNPFFTFSNPKNLFAGNPNLNPEFTHSIELGHIKYWDKASFSSAIYYRHTDGVIERITRKVGIDSTETRPQNLATEDAMGLEFTFSADVKKWWKMDGDMNFYRSITDGESEGISLYADTYTWFARLNNRVTVAKNIDMQMRLNYRAPRETTQGKQKSYTTMDLGASKDIFKNKGTLTLSVRDVFNSRRRRSISFNEGFYQESSFQWRSRQITLSLNYRLNQNKKRGGRGDGGDRGGDFEGGEGF